MPVMDANVLSPILLIVRLAIAAVFALAGAGKLVDRSGTAQALRDFGVPAQAVGALGVLLPVAELAIALALLPSSSAWGAAIAGALLLLAFTAGIGANLARGRRPACHCFGQLSSAPVSGRTILRNLLLAAVAAIVVAQGPAGVGPSALAWPAGLSVSQGVTLALLCGVLALVGAEAWLLLQLISQNGRLLLRIDAYEARLDAGANAAAPAAPASAAPQPGLPVGSPAPGFRLDGLFGEVLTLDALRASGKPVVLTFVDPNCGPCNALLPELAEWQRERKDRITLVLISHGTAEANRPKASEHGLSMVLLQHDREVAEAYQSSATPSAVLVRTDGTIGSPAVPGADAIRTLVSQASGDGLVLPSGLPQLQMLQNGNGNGNGHAHAPQVIQPSSSNQRIGTPAPVVNLPDLIGKSVSLSDFRGSPTLVLFWNPGCGFCQQMLGDLTAWEANPPGGAPKLLVVSTGSPEANKAHGLKSPIVLDQNFAIGAAFGVSGTPSAVLVDERGNIASDVAVGAPAVLSLARRAPASVA